MTAARRSAYVPGLSWRPEDKPVCGLCFLPVDLSLDTGLIRVNGVLTRHPLSFTEDHIVPRSMGGANEPGNIQPAHFYCNTSKGAKGSADPGRLQERVLEFMSSGFPVARSNLVSCGICGTEFYVPGSFVLKGRKFCSPQCQAVAIRTRMEVSCAQCGAAFTTTPSRLAAGKGKFCSRECYSASSGGEELTCGTCGRAFRLSPSNRKPSARRACSSCRRRRRTRPV